MESGILGFGICNSTQGIRNLINDWLSRIQVSLIRHLESVESRIQDDEDGEVNKDVKVKTNKQQKQLNKTCIVVVGDFPRCSSCLIKGVCFWCSVHTEKLRKFRSESRPNSPPSPGTVENLTSVVRTLLLSKGGFPTSSIVRARIRA